MMMSVFSQFSRLWLLEPSVPDLIEPLFNLFFLVWRFDTLVDANIWIVVLNLMIIDCQTITNGLAPFTLLFELWFVGQNLALRTIGILDYRFDKAWIRFWQLRKLRCQLGTALRHNIFDKFIVLWFVSEHPCFFYLKFFLFIVYLADLNGLIVWLVVRFSFASRFTFGGNSLFQFIILLRELCVVLNWGSESDDSRLMRLVVVILRRIF